MTPRARLDFRIPVYTLVVAAATMVGFVWQGGEYYHSIKSEIQSGTARISALEQWQAKNDSVNDRLIRVEEQLKSLPRIERKLDKLIEDDRQ